MDADLFPEIIGMYPNTVDRYNSDGTKAEEPWIGTSLHKRPSSPGSKDHMAKRPKYPMLTLDVICEPYKGPSSPGTKGEKPNLGTSPLHKLPCYTGSDPEGPKDTFWGRPSVHLTPEACRGKCLVCSLVDDHPTSLCPYLNFLPEDAIVSSGTEIICKFCGEWNGSWSCCKVQGRAVLKSCALCAKCGDHWSRMCPRRVSPCSRLPESSHQASKVNNMAEPSSFRHPHGRSSSVLDKQLKGTTILALIGQDAIYVATDERCSDKPSPYMIVTENSPKTFVISNNVLATISGDPDICWSMLTHAKLRVEQDIAVGRYESNEAVVAAASHALQYVATWEGQNPNIRFPSQTLIAGWANGAPSVYEIPSRRRLHEPKHDRGDGFAIGSGEQYVYDYYDLDDPFPSRRGHPPRSDEELAQIAKRAIVYSALNDRFTGGRARLGKVRQDGIDESHPEEILQVLHDDYDIFKTYLSCMIFCLYRKSDYEYASDNENLLSDAINVRFTPTQGSCYLIGIKEKYYIRIVRFEDGSTARKEFEGVKSQWKQLGYAHTQDVEVNAVIRGLPWIELPQLPHIPLVFSMATKKMINLFLDL